jgi:hypothetical protein
MALAYPDRVRIALLGLIAAAMLTGATAPATFRQAQASAETTKDQFFSGTVTAVDEAKITVERTVLGKPSATRTFVLTSETRFEGGTPKANSRVTVRFVTGDAGDRALHVIVRSPARK